MYPTELKYTSSHEWIRQEENEVIIGVTEYAQIQLGDLVNVDLPDLIDNVHASDDVCTLEAQKTILELCAPLSGNIIAVNEDLLEAPGLINSDPYGDGWLYRLTLKDTSELAQLLTATEYRDTLEG